MEMNSFFSSIGTELAFKVSTVSNPLLSCSFVSNKSNAKFQFKSIQVKEIRDALVEVETTKGFGVDNISSCFLKFALLFVENSDSLV